MPINAFSSFYVLGDSLSDVGNAYDAPFTEIPESPPYWHGRFSNGPVWADRVAGAFKAEGVRTDNLAWGGALADGPGVPDIGAAGDAVPPRSTATSAATGRWCRSGAAATTSSHAAGKARARKEGRQAARGDRRRRDVADPRPGSAT